MLTGLLWLTTFMLLSGRLSGELLASASFAEMPMDRRCFTVAATAFTIRAKYYGLWSLAEGSSVLAGVTAIQDDTSGSKPRQAGLRNVNALAIELAQNTRAYLINWNIGASMWLRHYFYTRLSPGRQKPGLGTALIAFFLLAISHGFEAGFQLSFFATAFADQVAKCRCQLCLMLPASISEKTALTAFITALRRRFRPIVLNIDQKHGTRLQVVYNLGGWVMAQTMMAFTVAPYLILNLEASLRVWWLSYVSYHILKSRVLACVNKSWCR